MGKIRKIGKIGAPKEHQDKKYADRIQSLVSKQRRVKNIRSQVLNDIHNILLTLPHVRGLLFSL